MGKYRKTHIMHLELGDSDYPVFGTGTKNIGVHICYDQRFLWGIRATRLNGTKIMPNPYATVAELFEYSVAVVERHFVGAINRVCQE